MSKLIQVKFLQVIAAMALAAGAFTFTAGSAQAQHHGHHGGYHGGYRHGGGGVYFGFGAPYAYYPPAYYGPACRYVRVRVWHHGWRWRTVRRCY